MELTSFEFFVTMLSELADAFLDMNVITHEWGVHFERKDSEDWVLCTQPSRHSINYIQQLDDIEYVELQDVAQDGTFEIWKREYEKQSFPFLDRFQIDSFSFSDRRRNSAQLYNSLDFLPRYMGISGDRVKQFERIPRGFLHIFERARLWVIQDSDQKPISLAISISKDEGELGIPFLATNMNYRKRGFASSLVKAILSKQAPGAVSYIIRENSNPSEKWLKELGFKKSISFSAVEQ